MTIARNAVVALFAAFFALAANAQSNPKKQLEDALSHDGLQQAKVKGVAMVYTRPGASLANYTKVQIDPVDVAFHKDWNPERTGSRLKLSQRERDDIRNGVAKIVEEQFAKVMQAKGGYQVVKEAGPDVLRLRPRIANLYVTAPDTGASMSRTYSVSAGEMTLFLEMFDSETGAVMARVVDHKAARSDVRMRMSSKVLNAGEAEAVAAEWARILRDAFDKAHGVGKN